VLDQQRNMALGPAEAVQRKNHAGEHGDTQWLGAADVHRENLF
jgi:hypothetical protein